MNIAPINYNSNIYSNTVRNIETPKVSFSGKKQIIVETAKEASGCVLPALILIVASPFLLIQNLFENKESKISLKLSRLTGEYEEHHGSLNHFREDLQEVNQYLDKYSKNSDYAQFVKEVMDFLHTKFKEESYHWDRVALFNNNDNDNGISNLGWKKFEATLITAAQMAVSKNGKGIDKEQLDKAILVAREIIQQNQ